VLIGGIMSDKKEVLNVEKWILELKYSKPMVEELSKCDIEVTGETEKAVKLLFTSENLSHEDWFPRTTKDGKRNIVTFK
jgi:hypothetical protein